ncbi:MAG: hypothetical protein KME08_09195 [Aphanothece sp. CMT-3BRIN-NPC111]|jgi:hypothetical protein|nr:hypothetical protein [Aphanothece sp. CMT-3BRIN-NPC111]
MTNIPDPDFDYESTIIQAYNPNFKRESKPSKDNHPEDKFIIPKVFDDATLVKAFVQGQNKLLATQSLRIEAVGDTTQLLTKKGELIGLLKISDKARSALVKTQSEYYGLINKIFLEEGFVPFGESKKKGFFEYRQYEIPKGYKINYTESLVLWKAWWPTRRSTKNFRFKLDILFFVQNNWYPIQDMVFSDGNLYIKTLVGEFTLHGTDKVVWLNQLETEPTQKENLDLPASKSDFKDSIVNTQLSKKQNINVETNSKAELETEIEEEQLLRKLKLRALQTLSDYLENGEVKVKTEVIKDAKGENLSTKTITFKNPCPQWVLEYLLAKND